MKKPSLGRLSICRPSEKDSPDHLIIPHLFAQNFIAGEVYLFHTFALDCPPSESLWAIFDKRIGTAIYLESSSSDLLHFRKWLLLPVQYSYCRLATRNELRDYIANLTWFECRSSVEPDLQV